MTEQTLSKLETVDVDKEREKFKAWNDGLYYFDAEERAAWRAWLAAKKQAAEVVCSHQWNDGTPPHPYDKEWFLAKLDNGDRVVLQALPEEYSYDFRTADDTYFKRFRVKAWMQLEGSMYIDFHTNQTRHLYAKKGE